MNEMRLDRTFTWLGVASVVTELAGTFIGFAGGSPQVTVTASSAAVAKAVAHPLAPIGWVGSYIELLSTGLFLAFAVWACARLGGGVVGAFGQACAAAVTVLTIGSLAPLDVVEYEQGHGLGLASARVLTKLNSALYITSWFPTAFFLLAVALLALRAGRTLVGWTAIAAAVATLAAVALSVVSNAGQLLALAPLVWILGASIALGRSRARARAFVATAAA